MDKEFWIFLAALVTVFSGAMKLMWDALKRDHINLEKACAKLGAKADKCEEDRHLLHREVDRHATDLCDLRHTIAKCTGPACPMK